MAKAVFLRIFLPLLVVVYSVVLWRTSQIPLENSGSARSQIRGDSFTENLALNGAKYFYDHGFWETKFMPNYGYTGEVAKNKVKEFRKEWVYTHYPSLPDVLIGLTAIALQTTDSRYLRILPIFCSFLLLWLMWRTVSLLLRDKEAYVSFAVLLLSNYFVAWADSLHKFLYEEILKWAILYIFVRRFRIGPQKVDIPLLALLYFLVACVSLDAIVVVATLCVGFSLIYRKKLFSQETVIPGLATVAALALHLYQNVLFFGSFAEAWHDLSKIFQSRTIGAGGSEVGALTLGMWLKHFFFWNINRVERYFLIPGWALLVFALLIYRKWKSEDNPNYLLIPLLLLAAVSWNCVMWQHAYVHVWTARNWGLFVGLISGPALLFLWEKLRSFRQHSPIQKAGIALLTFYVMGMAITQHFWDLYLRHGFLYTFIPEFKL